MRKLWISLCLICGVLLLGCALLMPAHFRAVDSAVLEGAGKGKPDAAAPTLIEEGITFLSVEKLGPAQMLLRVAQSEAVPRHETLAVGVAQFVRDNPALAALGGATPVLEKVDLDLANVSEPRPIIDLLSRRAAREKALGIVQQSRRPGVQQILRNRVLTNTTHFPSATSSSGQALDAAIVTAALLYQGDYFTPTFRDAFEWLAMRANRGDDSGSLELVYLDLLSLGRRLDWVSLTELMKRVDTILISKSPSRVQASQVLQKQNLKQEVSSNSIKANPIHMWTRQLFRLKCISPGMHIWSFMIFQEKNLSN